MLVGNVMEEWVPVGAVLTGLFAVSGAVVTFFRFMNRQETKIDTLGHDLKEHRASLDSQIEALCKDIEHKFERLEDRNSSYLRHREFYTWIEHLRAANPTLSIPPLDTKD